MRLTALHLNQQALHFLLADPNGPVGADLIRRAQNVTRAAGDFASGMGGGPNIRSGALNTSLHYVILSGAEGLVAQIGTDQTSPRQDFPYPLSLETGTDPVGGGPMPRRPFLEPALQAFDP